MTEQQRLQRLTPPQGRVRAVLDTDTYNEVDDQFALAYALCSPESMELEAVYAAPFFNERARDPEDGMAKSYDEILHVFSLMGRSPQGRVFKGSRGYLSGPEHPRESEAAADLVRRAMALPEGEILYVMAIGAITNWDIAAVAWLIQPEWVPGALMPSPFVSDDLTWAEAPGRHLIRCATHVHRDPVFGDLFAKLAREAGG